MLRVYWCGCGWCGLIRITLPSSLYFFVFPTACTQKMETPTVSCRALSLYKGATINLRMKRESNSQIVPRAPLLVASSLFPHFQFLIYLPHTLLFLLFFLTHSPLIFSYFFPSTPSPSLLSLSNFPPSVLLANAKKPVNVTVVVSILKAKCANFKSCSYVTDKQYTGFLKNMTGYKFTAKVDTKPETLIGVSIEWKGGRGIQWNLRTRDTLGLIRDPLRYIGTTPLHKGHLLWHHANLYYFTSEMGITSLQGTKLLAPKCPLFGGSTVCCPTVHPHC